MGVENFHLKFDFVLKIFIHNVHDEKRNNITMQFECLSNNKLVMLSVLIRGVLVKRERKREV